jgi:hypothetical protein
VYVQKKSCSLISNGSLPSFFADPLTRDLTVEVEAGVAVEDPAIAMLERINPRSCEE